MLKVWKFFKLEFQWIIAGVNTVEPEVYQKAIKEAQVSVIYGQTYDVLKHAYAAVVTSGTASLETAILNIPQFICYKGSPISYSIARRVVDIKYIGLPNLIMDKPIVKELIQHDLNQENLIEALNEILFDSDVRENILKDYATLREILGGDGASDRTAAVIQQVINN